LASFNKLAATALADASQADELLYEFRVENCLTGHITRYAALMRRAGRQEELRKTLQGLAEVAAEALPLWWLTVELAREGCEEAAARAFAKSEKKKAWWVRLLGEPRLRALAAVRPDQALEAFQTTLMEAREDWERRCYKSDRMQKCYNGIIAALREFLGEEAATEKLREWGLPPEV
jgi:hypothetical protein